MGRKGKTTEDFVALAVEKHGRFYDYSASIYTKSYEDVQIICPMHGEFSQRADVHTAGKGCPTCSPFSRVSPDEFVRRSLKLYGDKFEIISGSFRGMKHPVQIVCKTHGVFQPSMAEVHLRGHGGCKKCAQETRMDGMVSRYISKAETRWLDSIGVPVRQHRVQIAGRVILLNGFDPATNTAYEFYGSYWHGCPKKHDPNGVNVFARMTFGELYERTLEREKLIKSQFNLVTQWEIPYQRKSTDDPTNGA